MKKYSISLKEKKFLIYWNIFHLFGLFVTMFSIRGEFSIGKNMSWYLWNGYSSDEGFWPFVAIFEKIPGIHYRGVDLGHGVYVAFNGIYYQYSIEEYLFY